MPETRSEHDQRWESNLLDAEYPAKRPFCDENDIEQCFFDVARPPAQGKRMRYAQ